MGAIGLFAKIGFGTMAKQTEVVTQPEEVSQGLPIIPDAIDVTLAEYDVQTKNAITAHHLKDYRRKRFNLNLLPEVHTLFDCVLEGSDYWNELLHNEDAYY